MPDIFSPLKLKELIECNGRVGADPEIYSMYWYKADNMGGIEENCFAIFYSSVNDMNQTWMREVQLLWEAGKLTNEGEKFLKMKWEKKGAFWVNS